MNRTELKVVFVYGLLWVMRFLLYSILLLAAGLATWLFARLLDGMI